jgi:hypothetical protein
MNAPGPANVQGSLTKPLIIYRDPGGACRDRGERTQSRRDKAYHEQISLHSSFRSVSDRILIRLRRAACPPCWRRFPGHIDDNPDIIQLAVSSRSESETRIARESCGSGDENRFLRRALCNPSEVQRIAMLPALPSPGYRTAGTRGSARALIAPQRHPFPNDGARGISLAVVVARWDRCGLTIT